MRQGQGAQFENLRAPWTIKNDIEEPPRAASSSIISIMRLFLHVTLKSSFPKWRNLN